MVKMLQVNFLIQAIYILIWCLIVYSLHRITSLFFNYASGMAERIWSSAQAKLAIEREPLTACNSLLHKINTHFLLVDCKSTSCRQMLDKGHCGNGILCMVCSLLMGVIFFVV